MIPYHGSNIDIEIIDLAVLLSKDYGMDIPEALDTLYNSETYTKLTDPRSGMYFQSSFMYIHSSKMNWLSGSSCSSA